MVQQFRQWKRSIQLEIVVSFLLVGWKIVWFVVMGVTDPKSYILLYSGATLFQWVYACLLVLLESKKGVSRSWKLRLFWVIAFITATIKLRTLTLGIFHQTETIVSILEYLSFIGGYILILILSITAVLFFDNDMSYEKMKDRVQGEVDANLFSRITFWWINDVLRKGYKNPLDMSDVPSLTELDWAKNLSEKFEAAWDHQLTLPKPSLVRALSKAFGPHFYVSAIFKAIQDALLFVGPILLGNIITFVTTRNVSTYDGMLYVLFYFLAPIVQSLTLHQYFHRCFRVGMWLRSAVVTSVYRKALRTSLREGTTVGEIVNLMSVDAQKFMDLCPYLHMIWSAPAQIAVALILLYRQLGPPVFAGLAVMLIMIPINLYISNLAKKRTTVSMRLKDRRTKAVNEVLNGIKVIKLYSWEQSFMDHVKSIRDEELSVMKIIKYIQGISLLLWSMSPIFVSVFTFTVYVLMGGKLTAAIAFPCLSLFNVMQFPINMLPNVVSSLIEASVSVNRLQNFLLRSELNPNVVSHTITEPNVAIKIEGATMEWESGKETLKNINLTVNQGELIAIVGQVGSGKSSLVSSLVGDLSNPAGSIAVKGSISLVTQQAWIQNATLKDNVLFASLLNEDRYQKVIDACALIPDIAILPGGDQTEIGEKGINLSGGQKQRVSIARAVYNDSDIYLFDDPLSAVDAHVGRSIFQNVIGHSGLLVGKTRVLVTHGVHYLPFVDRVVMMKEGRIVEEGAYDDLLNADGPFSSLMKHHNESSSPDSLKDEEEVTNKLRESLDKSANRSEKLSSSTSNSQAILSPPQKNVQDEQLEEEDEEESLIPKQQQEEEEDLEDVHLEKNHNEEEDGIEMSPTQRLVNNAVVTPTPSSTTPTTAALADDKLKSDNKIIQVESRQEGKVSFKVYLSYFKALGGLLSGSIMGFYVATQALSIMANWWLSVWSDQSNADNARYYLSIYVAFSMGAVALTFFKSFGMVFGSIRGSKLFHEKMFMAVIRSPMSFFDTTPIGRILNRFSKDQFTIDEVISRTFGMFLNTFCQVFGSIIVIGIVSPFIILAMIPIAALFFYIQKYYLNSSRELTRLEGISRSPIYAHFSETLAGVTTIRAFQEGSRFIKQNEKLLDDNQKCYYINISANRWLALRLEFLGACIVTSTVMYTVLASHHIAPGTAGLVITYALAITSNMNWMVRMSCDLENSVVSVERIQEYCQLPSEAALKNDYRLGRSWPDHGTIVFKDLWLAYREGLEPVLRGINCTIEARHKIGIVGRTGAGKSSLTQALFRLVEPLKGTIEIDGVDITELGLHDLRSRVAIVPQDPVIFAGTIRSNLDPFTNFNDQQLWEALERTHLKKAIQDLDGGLDTKVQENGENFSVGQRQLLCMGRALLKKAKIIVMDEATAAIDIETDALIQQTIRSEFAECTVLTIAHRINTIIDSDKVMVLDKGELVEYDSPQVLTNNHESIFYSLVEKSGH
ncbi:ABC transporter C family protein [Cavenderia fasciculata]|uniref:ABC transporter C family protein n=1 Tax=Cavenderia fasciculata TaxID=261658 RepID=F4Q1X8_CACFS|nr:ABC transporter C family protein [Cavenderia fasciculata]EGG17998.1 ABC transporter C family protein [Cavenderia fasciculata]|eukprot:XP_004356891.1 ABC transporter C family protein [Cavenderia fasciculata]